MNHACQEPVALMVRYIDGDKHAFTQLYPLLRDRVRAELSRFGLTPDTLDDLAQQTMLRAHHARVNFEAADCTTVRLLAWYGAIARRTAMDWLRAEQRRTARRLRAGRDATTFVGVKTAAPGPERRYIATEDRDHAARLVQVLLRELPPPQRLAIELLKLEELDATSAGQRLGTLPNTLRVRAHRGMRRMLGIVAQDRTG